MDRVKVWLLIIGMMAVTYIPRMLPLFLVDKLKYGPKVEKFLRLIPYTAMSALIFPGVLSADGTNPAVGIVGGITAAVLAWRKCPVMVCVLGAIVVDFGLYFFIK